MKSGLILFTTAFLFWLLSCSKSSGDFVSNNYFQVPEGWPYPQYDFSGNPINYSGFQLGKKLFYDPILSRDSSISCGSCHHQNSAFADGGKAISTGIDGLTGTRNSLTLFNLAWNPDFMWDGGINHIEIQPFAPITNPVEMDESLSIVLSKLNNNSNYKSEFKNAFGTDSITSQLLFKALTQFMGSMVSANSKYDQVKNNSSGINFTTDEQAGYLLFKSKCESCHREPLFTDFSFRNNGLPIDPTYNDYGRYIITFDPTDSMKFKIPSLRNVMLTSPYMHDGRFATIDQVLDHYQSGIISYSNLDPLLSLGISLTPTERNQLKAFLNTLSDFSFINDPRFSE